MNRALLWREWQEMASPVTWTIVALVFGVVTTRFLDEIVGVAVGGACLGLILGNAATASERSLRVREFLLTRPVSRARFLRVKLLFSFGLLNLALGAIVVSIAFDLPRLVYGVVAETTLGARLHTVDAPLFYPAAFAYANCVLALVVYCRLFARSPVIGTVLALILSVATGIAAGRLLVTFWAERGLVAVGLAAFFAVAAMFLLTEIRRRFARLEVTGGGA